MSAPSKVITGQINNSNGPNKARGEFATGDGKKLVIECTFDANFYGWEVPDATCTFSNLDQLKGSHKITSGQLGLSKLDLTFDNGVTITGYFNVSIPPSGQVTGTGVWSGASDVTASSDDSFVLSRHLDGVLIDLTQF
jgi:hypothetical protein